MDVALYDSFTSSLGKDTRLRTLLQDPTIASLAVDTVYSFTSDPAAVRDSLDAGAHGFLSKSLTAPELVSSIEQIAAGNRVTLTGSGSPIMAPTSGPPRRPASRPVRRR